MTATPAADQGWDHNVHHHPVVLAAVRPWHRTALDVGCGTGLLARRLARVVPSVTGLDADAGCVRQARVAGGGVRYLHADVMAGDVPGAPFDLVTCVAALHHLGSAAGLRRLAHLVAPGGTLVVVGLARTELPRDLLREAAAVVARQRHRRRPRSQGDVVPLVWPPDVTFRQARALAGTLPGARYRRHVLCRWSLVWTRPAGTG